MEVSKVLKETTDTQKFLCSYQDVLESVHIKHMWRQKLEKEKFLGASHTLFMIQNNKKSILCQEGALKKKRHTKLIY